MSKNRQKKPRLSTADPSERTAPPYPGKTIASAFPRVRFVDLFCGVGGFRIAAETAIKEVGYTPECVFSSDIDRYCQGIYKDNFGETPHSDISTVSAEIIGDHELLLAGFPCQPFSVIGDMKGLADTRGTLFYEIERILKRKKPAAFVLENVKMLRGHDGGRTLSIITSRLEALGYSVDFKILNALDFGLPQRRERIWIVGLPSGAKMTWPQGKEKMKPLSSVLQKKVPPRFYASPRIQTARKMHHSRERKITIWHENVSGNVSKLPYSCALRAGASYNYLLVNGERRLTPREMFRLQGFPDTYKITVSDSQARRQAGNSLPVPVAKSVIRGVIDSLLSGTFIPR
jgi:DNA (cytosine-5)-methyltransferase 1